MRTLAIAVLAGICALAPATRADAQGNGRGHAYGKRNQSASGSGAAPAPAASSGGGAAHELQPAGAGIRNFGAWLDDASVMPQGQGALTVSFAYWRTPSYREFDFPVADGAIGVSRRVQFGISVPYYHASEPGGPVARGLGDLYLSTKIQLREPSATGSRVGFAVTPLLEILSFAPSPDHGRVSWALPANVEFPGEGWRAFGSAGYFSRGSVFASGALEIALSDRTWLTGSISQSHSLERDDLSTALGLAQTRTDASGGLGVSVLSNVAVFGTVGRTLSSRDPTSASLFLTSGVSLSFDARSRPTPRR
jgi:hypothetical protein